MYLARFEASTGDWIQVTAKIEAVAAGRQARSRAAWDLIAGQLAAAARIPNATVALRFSLNRRHALSQLVAVTVPADRELDVREVFARLTRVERLQKNGVSLPAERSERDAWMEQLGPLRLGPSADGYSVSGIPLACNFRIAAALDELLTNACLAGDALTYQVHLRSADISPEWVRSARKNMLALRELAGIRPNLLTEQEELARSLGQASAFCEEYLVVEREPFASTVEQLLSDRFRERFRPLGFPEPAFRFETGAYQDALTLGIHRHDLAPLGPVALCSAAESPAGRDQLLAWQPSARLQTLLEDQDDGMRADDAEGEAPSAAAGQVAPQPYAGDGPAVFVSYRRTELPRASEIIRLLQRLGVNVWYDRGIPGGSEWDEVIEERLRKARFVVACASQAAIASKYVRREIKFADALGVPILPVLLEDVAFGHGMGMLLTQYQMLDARSGQFEAALREAVARLW